MPDDRADLSLTARRAKTLRGRIGLPGDHAVAMRAIAIATLAVGRSELDGLPDGDAVRAMCAVATGFGARVTRIGERCSIDGLGVGGMLAPLAPIDIGGSRLALLLALGLAAPLPITVTLIGSAAKTPLTDELLQPLERLGAVVTSTETGLAMTGPALPLPIDACVTEQAAGVKSALLLAGLALPGTTRITGPALSRDHTEILLTHFGASIDSQVDGAGTQHLSLRGQPNLRPQTIMLPGDTSLASFPVVAALLVPGAEVSIENVLVNPGRTGLIDTLLEMGGNIEFTNQRQSGGEFVADLRVRHSRLRGQSIRPDRTAALSHDYQALAIAAAFAEGQTSIGGLGQLHDRNAAGIEALIAALKANGVAIEAAGDSLVIAGGDRMGGATIATGSDYRLAMALLVLGLVARDPVTVRGAETIAPAFPQFLVQLQAAGAEFVAS